MNTFLKLSLNMSDVEKTLEEMLESIAIEQRYDRCQIVVKRLPPPGGNYMDNLYKAVISSKDRNDLKLFAKVALPMSAQIRQESFTRLYHNEMVFYTEIARRFNWLQDKHHITGRNRIVFPKFYGCNMRYSEEIAILEDLEATGFACWNRLESLDWKYAATAVEELAKFHALSFAYGEEDPEGCKRMFEKMMYVAPSGELLRDYTRNVMTAILKVTKEENRERVGKFAETHGGVLEVALTYCRPLERPVLRHGDYKTTNLMFKECPDGTMYLTVVDFQTVQTGCVLGDLLCLVFTSTDRQFRRRYFHQIIEYYYTQLCAALARFGLEPDRVYSREDFDKELKKMLPYGLMVAIYFLPAVMATKEEAEARDSSSLVSFAVRPSSTRFADRFNEVVDDYIQWGLL